MQKAIRDIADMIEGIDYLAFTTDSMRQKAIIRDFETLGEAASRLPHDVRALALEIPSRLVIAMRNQLIHGYFRVDLSIVWQTATQELPALSDPLQRLCDRVADS